jgi:inosine/xanthosine triphosphate pyrophosphatase family protein
MEKFVYVTTNPEKVKEAQRVFVEKYNLPITITQPEIEILEIQSKTCIEVAKFSAKYADLI